jgi:hypothetical protein
MMLPMKVLSRIDPLSATKIFSLLGILWAFLGWLMNGLVILYLAKTTPEEAAMLPAAFSFSGLLTGIVGGFLGGVISGYLGSLVYNLLAKKTGGVWVELDEAPVRVSPSPTA